MPRYINDHCSFLRGEDGEFAPFGGVVVLSEAKANEIRAYSSGVLPPAESAPAPAPKPAPLPVEPAPPPAVKPAASAVEREPLDALHHAKLRKLAEALGHTGDGSKADSLAFLDGCEPAEVDAAREGLGY